MQMGSRKYLVVFYAVSSGQNGPNLGADEEEIVLLLYLVLDADKNKVRIAVGFICENCSWLYLSVSYSNRPAYG